MKIKIEHASNPLNYGTNMMVTNFMYYLDSISNKNNEYLLDVNCEADLEYYKNLYNESNISKQTIDYNFIKHRNFINKVINKIKRELFFKYFNNNNINKLVKSVDYLVVLGGDDLSEYYGLENLKREFNRLNIIKNKIKITLVGQTIGPFYDERKVIAKKSFEGINIYSRDPWTSNYLINELKISSKYINDSADLAFLNLPNQNDDIIKNNILNKYEINSDKYITIVPSGLYISYCYDLDNYIENYCKIIKYISEKLQGYKIVLLPHVLTPSLIDDRNIIKELKEKLKDRFSHILYIYDEMTPLEARFILGNGIFTITGRMHGAISTFQMRKPAISISYSVKYNGVIGEGLDCKELIVDGKGNDLWSDLKVYNQVKSKIDYVLENYEEIINKIDCKVAESEKKTIAMIEDITSELS